MEEKDYPRDYFVPDFGVAEEIIDATDALKVSEKMLGKQLHAVFDYKKIPGYEEIPRDYFVPDFGVDHDILDSEHDLSITETTLNHVWNPVYNEEKKFWENMPASAANSSYTYAPYELSSPEGSAVTKTFAQVEDASPVPDI